MAATTTLIHNTQDVVPSPINGIHHSIANVVFDSSYPTGGEAVDLQDDLGLPASGATIQATEAVITAGSEAGIATAEYNTSTEKVLLYKADGTQTASMDDASAVKVTVQVWYTT